MTPEKYAVLAAAEARSMEEFIRKQPPLPPKLSEQEAAIQQWTSILQPDNFCYQYYATLEEWRVSIERLVSGLKSGELNAEKIIWVQYGKVIPVNSDIKDKSFLLVHDPKPTIQYANLLVTRQPDELHYVGTSALLNVTAYQLQLECDITPPGEPERSIRRSIMYDTGSQIQTMHQGDVNFLQDPSPHVPGRPLGAR